MPITEGFPGWFLNHGIALKCDERDEEDGVIEVS